MLSSSLTNHSTFKIHLHESPNKCYYLCDNLHVINLVYTFRLDPGSLWEIENSVEFCLGLEPRLILTLLLWPPGVGEMLVENRRIRIRSSSSFLGQSPSGQTRFIRKFNASAIDSKAGTIARFYFLCSYSVVWHLFSFSFLT